MTAYELLLAIKDYCEGDIKETIQQIHDVVDGVENRGLLHSLIEESEQLALTNDLCPKCGEQVKTIKISEEKSEYFGRDVSETIYTRVCKECNYTID